MDNTTTVRYVIFMLFMLAAFGLMVTAWIRMIGFFRRNRQPEQDTLNPLNGPRLWVRFFTPGSLGAALEPERRNIASMYIKALVSFLIACFVFVMFPFVPPD